MQFLKKNYEKVLLGAVLCGMVVVAVFMFLLVNTEKQRLAEQRSRILERPVTPVDPPDVSRAEVLLKRGGTPVALDFSSTHKLFNPVRWQRGQDGQMFPNPRGRELDRLEVTRITPLYLSVSLDRVSEPGRFAIGVEQQAASSPNQRGKRVHYVSEGARMPVGDKKDALTLKSIEGPPEDPTALVLELEDAGQSIRVTKDKAFTRVDGYEADLRYPPENNKLYPRTREGTWLLIAREVYNVVAITENEVVLSAKSNNKKHTIRFNAAP